MISEHGCATTRAELLECHDCGLFQRGRPTRADRILVCGRCGAHLQSGVINHLVVATICAVLSLLFLLLAAGQPLFSMHLAGRFSSADLIAGPLTLAEHGMHGLAAVVAVLLFFVPTLHLAVSFLALASAHKPLLSASRMQAMGVLGLLRRWSMIEVYLLAAFIAYVRLSSWTQVGIGRAAISLVGFVLVTIAYEAAFDPQRLWQRVPVRRPELMRQPARLIACSWCRLVSEAHDGARCLRCGHVLRHRVRFSVARAWACSLAAALLAIPANVLPVMDVTQFGRRNIDTIVSGMIELTHHDLWGLAVLIFIASIVIPLLKLIGLAWMLILTARRRADYLKERTRLFRLIHTIGRWSMVDVFAVTILVSLVHLGLLAAILPGYGAVAFCGVVILTMVATESFDPRLMWDAAGLNEQAQQEKA